jgi:anti-anti-sigma factor
MRLGEMALKPAGFWSYTTSDDAASHGRLSRLRCLLADEMQAKIGRLPKVTIFQDVKTIPYGSNWQNQITTAIDGSSFFLPIITPAFLQSEGCYREVQSFRDRQKTLSRDDLIFPIHYLDVTAFNSSRRSECYDPRILDYLLTLQWADLRPLRLMPFDTSLEVAKGVERVAEAICAALLRETVMTSPHNPTFEALRPGKPLVPFRTPSTQSQLRGPVDPPRPIEEAERNSIVPDPRKPFYNKILFCDIVGYSKRDALGQYACQRTLNQILLSVVSRLSLNLGKEVVAVPTGDGAVLNFLAPELDVHLRTAIQALEGLSEASASAGAPFGLRIGLNSHVDTLVRDINNNMNVVGSGINVAQRVMHLGRHGQILMHDRVKLDLENYPEYAPKLVPRGEYTVKQGQKIAIAQYVDPICSYLCNDLVQLPSLPEDSQIDLEKILQHRIKDNLLSLVIDHRGCDHLDEIREYVEEFLDNHDDLQRLKVSVPWVVSEMLANTFAYGHIGTRDQIVLRLRRTSSGILVELEQPDVPDLQVEAVLQDDRHKDSFMQLVHRRGLRWRQRRIGKKRLELGLEIPNNLNLRPMVALTFDPDVGAALDLPTPVAAFLDGVTDKCVHEGLLLIRLLPHALDYRSAEGTRQFLLGLIKSISNIRGIIIDLSLVNYVASAGLQMLLQTSRMAKSNNFACVTADANPGVREIFNISRFNAVMQLYENSESAFRALTAA